MNKLAPLIDGTTIINFTFMGKLFKRYLKSSLVIAATLFVAGMVFYVAQENFYWTSISFSDATVDNSDAGLRNLSSMLGEKKGGLRATDILNLRSSIDFNRKVAEQLISSEFFNQLRFDLNILGNSGESAKALRKKCNDNEKCLIEVLVKRLPKFYQISDKDRSGVNFVLEVKALDVLTANVLLKVIAKSVLDSRIDVVRLSLKDQEKMNTNILVNKKKEVDVTSFYETQEERDRLDNEMKEIQAKVDHQLNVLTTLQDNLSSAEANYQHSKSISSKTIDNDEVDVELRRKQLREKIEKLNADLVALEDVSANPSEADKEIISQFKAEISAAKKKLRSLGKASASANTRQFVELNKEKVQSKEMEYRVLKDQMASAKQLYDELVLKKKDVLGRKIKTDQNLEILKPSIEFIKNLEMKIEQMKLLSVTVGPDVRFDSYAATPEPAKKISLIVLAGCLFILEFFVLILYLSLRYILDSHIYDESDIHSISPQLKIIGNGPRYE